MERSEGKAGDTFYMADELGLHRMENSSHTEKLVTMHCYSPPFMMCKVTSTVSKGQIFGMH